jgi:hypothetical protein
MKIDTSSLREVCPHCGAKAVKIIYIPLLGMMIFEYDCTCER